MRIKPQYKLIPIVDEGKAMLQEIDLKTDNGDIVALRVMSYLYAVQAAIELGEEAAKF